MADANDGEKHHTSADLVVSFKVELDGELLATMTQALVRYLMYLRGQIPCVYEEFIARVDSQRVQEQEELKTTGSRKRKLVSGALKKARALGDSAEQLIDQCLPQLFHRRVRTVAVVFGATVASPREVWVLNFLDANASPVGEQHHIKDDPPLARDRILKLCVQKLIRMLLTYATQHFSSPLAVTSTHLLVLADKEGPPVEGFTPKQNLKLKHPKTKKAKRSHEIQVLREQWKAATTSGHSTQSSDVEDGFIWYQSTRPLHGIAKIP